MPLDEIHPAPQHLVLGIRTRDVLQPEQTLALEQAVALREIPVEVFVPHRLKHFDRRNLVELPGQLPVVGQSQIDLVVQPRRRDPTRRLVKLCLRDCHRGDPASKLCAACIENPPHPLPISST